MNPLAAKLTRCVDLGDADRRVLDALCADVRPFKAKRDLIKEGERPAAVFVMIDGWAMRYKILCDGNRQITAYLVPGDMSDPPIFAPSGSDHSVGLLSDAQVAVIPRDRLLQALGDSPALTRALWWSTMASEGVAREWLVNVGRRNAYDRMAHLFSELWLRLEAIGATRDGSAAVPLTQTDLADTLGLTSVHVNRTLQRMRAEAVVEIAHGHLRIPDLSRLMAVTRFDAKYLQLHQAPVAG